MFCNEKGVSSASVRDIEHTHEHTSLPDGLVEGRAQQLAVVLGEGDGRDALGVGAFEPPQTLTRRHFPHLQQNAQCEAVSICKPEAALLIVGFAFSSKQWPCPSRRTGCNARVLIEHNRFRSEKNVDLLVITIRRSLSCISCHQSPKILRWIQSPLRNWI